MLQKYEYHHILPSIFRCFITFFSVFWGVSSHFSVYFGLLHHIFRYILVFLITFFEKTLALVTPLSLHKKAPPVGRGGDACLLAACACAQCSSYCAEDGDCELDNGVPL